MESDDPVVVRVVDLKKFLHVQNFLAGQIPVRVRLENRRVQAGAMWEVST